MNAILLDSNAWLRRVTGVDKFHAAGYFGSRVIAGTGEKVNTEAYSAGAVSYTHLTGRSYLAGGDAIGGGNNCCQNARSVFEFCKPHGDSKQGI